MTATSGSRVLIVDDHPLVSEGLARIIGEEERLSVCGQAASAEEARQLFAARRPEVVILDILLPDGDGFELIPEFLDIDADAKILVFSSVDADVYAPKARRLGAAGFVHKSMAVEWVVPAIRAALAEGDEK